MSYPPPGENDRIFLRKRDFVGGGGGYHFALKYHIFDKDLDVRANIWSLCLVQEGAWGPAAAGVAK